MMAERDKDLRYVWDHRVKRRWDYPVQKGT